MKFNRGISKQTLFSWVGQHPHEAADHLQPRPRARALRDAHEELHRDHRVRETFMEKNGLSTETKIICNLIQARNPTWQGERAEHLAGRRGVRLRVLAAARGGVQARHPPPHGSGASVIKD